MFGGKRMVSGSWWLAPTLLASVLVGTPLHAQDINWQEAVARLSRERTHAETCASVLKKYGDPAAKDRGSVDYGEAKAEYDGIIAGLSVALARRSSQLAFRICRAGSNAALRNVKHFVKAHCRLCPKARGRRALLKEIVSGAIGPLIQAVQAIYFRAKDDNLLTRKTIQTQLEATSWPAFASISPSR